MTRSRRTRGLLPRMESTTARPREGIALRREARSSAAQVEDPTTKKLATVTEKSMLRRSNAIRAGTSPAEREVVLWRRFTTRAPTSVVDLIRPRAIRAQPKRSELRPWAAATKELLGVEAMEASAGNRRGAHPIDCRCIQPTAAGARKVTLKSTVHQRTRNTSLRFQTTACRVSHTIRITRSKRTPPTGPRLLRNNGLDQPLPQLSTPTKSLNIADQTRSHTDYPRTVSRSLPTCERIRTGLAPLSARFKASTETIPRVPTRPPRVRREGTRQSRFRRRRRISSSIQTRTAPPRRQPTVRTRSLSSTASRCNDPRLNAPRVPRALSRRRSGSARRSRTLTRRARVDSRARKT